MAAPDDIAAIVGDQSILVRALDKQSAAQLSRLHDELSALLVRTVDRLIDDRIRASTPLEMSESPPPPSPISDEEVRSYQGARGKEGVESQSAKGTTRESEEQTARLRYYLEQKARDTANLQARHRLRQGHVIRFSLPSPQELESPMTAERQIARVDNLWIRAAEFEQAAAWRLYQLRGEIYRERRRNLEPAIENALLGNEARRRGLSTEALISELLAKESVSEYEIQEFIAAEREAGRPAPTVERAQAYLEFRKAYNRRQALLKELRGNTDIKILLKEPPLPSLPIDDSSFVVLGDKRGKRLVVYTNYRCADCRTAQQEIDTLLAQDKKVRVIFHDFIPGYDPVATEAAYLAHCAAQWGVFPRMRNELLTREPPSFGSHWYDIAAELPQLMQRLRVKKKAEFLECLRTDVYKTIAHGTANAREFGFENPPAFVAEGIPLVGTPSVERLTQALEQGLRTQLRRRQEVEEGNVPRKRRKGRRPSGTKLSEAPTPRRLYRGVRSLKEQEVSVETSPRQRPKPQPLVSKKTAMKLRREKLFDVE